MEMHWTRRAVVGAALSAIAAPAVVGVSTAQEKAAPAVVPAVKGKLTTESLGTLLKAMALEAKSFEERYDFNFKATIEKEEWELSMSAVLSKDGSSLWIMAWLDELPKSAADVPRTALLRLLSENDKLGKGKFFAYMASHRRFTLQRVIANENMTAATFRAALEDLGQSVVETYPRWSVSNWTSTTSEDPAASQRTGNAIKGSAPQPLPPQTGSPAATPAKSAAPAQLPVQSAVNDSKFNAATKSVKK